MNAHGEVFHGRLTRQVLMTLPLESWMVSGVTDNRGVPLFAGAVPAPESRPEFWVTLKNRGVAGNNVWIVATQEDLERLLGELRAALQRAAREKLPRSSAVH